MKFSRQQLANLGFTALGIALVALTLSIYSTVNSTQNNPTYYSQIFDVSLSTQVPGANSTLSLLEEIPLYSTLAQPPGFANVAFVIGNYEILAFDANNNPKMNFVGSVVYTDGDSIIIQGTITRDITVDQNGVILRNRLVSVNVGVIGGTGKYVGAYGNWQSKQDSAFTTRIFTEFQVPRW